MISFDFNQGVAMPEEIPFPLYFIAAFWVLVAIVHLGFAVGVYRDADELAGSRRGPAFVGPALWFLAILIGGVFAAGVYWLMHHSSLSADGVNPPRQRREFEAPPSPPTR